MAFASADPWAHAIHQLYPPAPDREMADAIEFAVRRSRGRYQRYRHVEIINAAVDETIATGGRLIVEASVRHSKSETISKWKAAHYIGTHPDNRVILAGHEADFAKRWGRAARDILEEHGPEVFGVRVSPRSGAANRWDIEGHDGGMLTVGVGGSPIGRGADLALIDDPVKSFEAAMSPLVRQRIIEWYTGTMASRIEPGGAVVIIMARWHSDDLAGYLQREDPDTWRVLRLPAICDDPAADAMGRQAGEPLWPQRWPLEALAERKRDVTMALGEAVWLAQYQQRPAAIGGGTFPEGRWGFMAPHDVPDGLRWVRAWDLAATEGAGDWTVGARMARLPDGRFVIDDVRRGQWDARDARARIKAAADMDPPGTTHELPQDPGQAGKDQAQQLVSLLAGHIVHARPQSGSKEVRAAGYAAQQQAGNVVLVEGQWNGAWVSEHAAFPRGSHDDQVDTGATAFNALAGVPDRPAKGRSPAGRRTARGPALARTGGRVTQ